MRLLEGELALAKGETETSVERLLLADREQSSPETVASLARALDIGGRRPQAIELCEKLIASGAAALGWEPQQPWIISHLRLAEIYLDQGERQRASKVLRPIIELWQQADQDLPLTARLRNLTTAAPAAPPSGV